MNVNILRYIQIALAITAIALFLYIAFTPREEVFTELYFTDIEEGDPAHILLSFTVKNHEPSGTGYSYIISVEHHIKGEIKREGKAEGNFWLEKGENRTFIEDIAVDRTREGNQSISVELYKDGERYRGIRKWLNGGS